jgi:Flp pilus assembly pilin Flp
VTRVQAVWHERAIGALIVGDYISSQGLACGREQFFTALQVSSPPSLKRRSVTNLLQQLWNDEHGQDIAEYAVMLAVILVIVVGTIRLIGSNANNVFSAVGSVIQ